MAKKSAWQKGVEMYAEELLEQFHWNYDKGEKITEEKLLNGAQNWKEYSWGGSALIYDYEIAERLCNPSELKKTRNGERRPNAREEWLDTQARALFQAARLVIRNQSI